MLFVTVSFAATARIVSAIPVRSFRLKMLATVPLSTVMAAVDLKTLSAPLASKAGELFDIPRAKPDPKLQRQARIRRGLKLWSERRLLFVCSSLRDVDRLLSAYCRVLTEENANETTWNILE